MTLIPKKIIFELYQLAINNFQYNKKIKSHRYFHCCVGCPAVWLRQIIIYLRIRWLIILNRKLEPCDWY